MGELQKQLTRISRAVQDRFESEKRVLSFEDFLSEVEEHPLRHARDAARYMRDCFDHYGSYLVERPYGTLRRHRLFDLPFESPQSNDRAGPAGTEPSGASDAEPGEPVLGDFLVANEGVQNSFYRALCNFVQEGRPNRLVLLHGPNGSAKSTIASCIMRGLEHYSRQPEGALYRFSWIFPRSNDGKSIGFDSREDGPAPGESYASLPEGRIDVKLSSPLPENPLLLLPLAERQRFLEVLQERGKIDEGLPRYLTHGQLSQKNRQVFEALLTSYRGDLRRVLAHVQVERYIISRRYRTGAVTIGPQMAVDASERQVTADHTLGALPASLSALTLYEPYGELVDACGGLVEYSDLLKRHPDAWKYLLLAIETGEVSLPLSTLPLNAVMMGSSNELHLSAFKEHPDYHSFRGRIQMVRVPYLVDYRQEQRIYDAQVAPQLSCHVAPHATYVAALWAVLSRLRRVDKDRLPNRELADLAADLSPLEKAELFGDGTVPSRIGGDDALRLRSGLAQLFGGADDETNMEGLAGASPREMRTLLLDAAQHPDYQCLSPLAVLYCIEELCKAGDYAFLKQDAVGGYHAHEAFIEQVCDRWLDRVDDEFRDSTGLVEETRYIELFSRYITHVSHSIEKERIYNRVTGVAEEPDVDLMRSLEQVLGVEEDNEGFRRNLLSKIAGHAIDNPGKEIDYAQAFPDLLERLKESYFSERRKQLTEIAEDVLRLLADEGDGLPAERAACARQAQTQMTARFGYQPESLRDAVGELVKRRYTAGSQ